MSSRFSLLSRSLARASYRPVKLSISCSRSIHFSKSRSQQQAAISEVAESPPQPVQLGKESLYHDAPIKISGQLYRFNSVFLRDGCCCPRCVDPSTQQKLFETAQIPKDIKAVIEPGSEGQSFKISWINDVPGTGEGHVTEYSAKTLLDAQQLSIKFLASREPLRSRTLWDGKAMREDNLWVDYQQYVSSDATLLDALRQLSSHGLVFLRNVPDDENSVVSIAERIGSLRDSFYGRTWNVRSVPEAKNIAYTHQYLGLHMDLLYMTNPPHLQLLHSLKAQAPGGESLFSDSFRAAEVIRNEDPRGFESLVRFPVTYHYKNASQHYEATRPTIELELGGIVGGQGGAWVTPQSFERKDDDRARVPNIKSAIQRINWSPPFQGPFRLINHGLGKYHETARRFSKLVNADENLFELRLAEGECVIFDNRRVLHARKAFDISGGERWLKGAYVDDDVYYSRLRVLEKAAAET